MEELREETIVNIRGCLVSVKGKLDLRQLCRDYKQLMGSDIPFRSLGCSSLEEFLRQIPSLFVSKGPGGQTFVDAKVTEKTSHISTMVSKQKATKKATRFVRQRQPVYQKTQPNKWRAKNFSNKWKASYENSPRPAAMSHNQFVSIPKSPSAKPAPIPRLAKQTKQDLSLMVTINKQKSPPLKPKSLIKEKSFESDSSASSSDKLPHSTKTNRSNIMPNIVSPTVPGVTAMENMRNLAIEAADFTSPVWNNNWTSSDSDSDKNSTFQLSKDDLCDLYNFCKFWRLAEPQFKVIRRQLSHKKPINFDCQVKIGDQAFSSYPNDFSDEMAAKYYACKLALEKLTKKYGTSKKQTILLSDEKDILKRIPDLVQKHYHGIWSWQLEDDYKDLYKEQLPANWLSIIDMSEVISIEAFSNKYVLRYCNPEDLLQKGKFSKIPLLCEISIPTSTVQFNEQELLLAEITCALSAKEIWCRQVYTPHADEFVSKNVQMEELYNQNYNEGGSWKAEQVIMGRYYVAWVDSAWYRVRVLEIEENDAQCLLVDFGDDHKVPLENIYQLRREFAKEQAQAFICRLAGLEELYEVSNASEALQQMEGKIVHLEPVLEEAKNGKFEPICVVIYDAETGNSINQELMSKISIENALPILDNKAPNEVHISNIEANGDIYIQIHTLGYEKLISLLNDLEATILENTPDLPNEPITPANSKDRLYFTKTSQDEKYSRIKIIDWSPDKKYAQIYYVDFGRTSIITVRDSLLYPLDELSTVVSRYPEQALKVRLDIEQIPTDFDKIITKWIPEDASVLLKVVGRSEDAKVKLFVRAPNDGLISVNDSIMIDVQRNKEKKFDKNVPSSGILHSPPLPRVGEYYDVIIPFAVNPWNFFVQPYDSHKELSSLMTKLQKRYADVQYSPLGIDDIKQGCIYASKHDDGNWYRTSVLKIIHSGSISVFYCDFGYYGNLRLQQLVTLDEEFLALPYQALKAKLSGIKPKQEKWTMEDCKFFQKLVCRKTFVSILLSIESDELYRYDTVLVLKLIDTSTPKDIQIEEVLVQKKIAVNTA